MTIMDMRSALAPALGAAFALVTAAVAGSAPAPPVETAPPAKSAPSAASPALAAPAAPAAAKGEPAPAPVFPPATAPAPAKVQPPAKAQPPAAVPEAATLPAGVVVENDELQNTVHGYRFPLLAGWEIVAGATPEAIDFGVSGCDDCLLRVMVSPGNTLPLDDTVRTIKEQIDSNPSARLLGQEPIRIAKQSAYTIVKEESAAPAGAHPIAKPADGKPAPAAPAAAAARLVRTRYVTFGYQEDKFYLVLKAPSDRFPADDAAFEKMLSRFRLGAMKGARSAR